VFFFHEDHCTINDGNSRESRREAALSPGDEDRKFVLSGFFVERVYVPPVRGIFTTADVCSSGAAVVSGPTGEVSVSEEKRH